MPKQLRIDIIVDDHGAVQKLGAVDAAVAKTDTTAKNAAAGWTTHSNAVKNNVLAFQSMDTAQRQSVARMAETSAATGGLTNAFGMMKGALGALGIAFGLQTIIGFAKELFNAADELTKLEARTGLSTSALQRLQYAGADAGNSVDELAAAVVTLQDKLAGGDKSATAALEDLGITISDLQKLSPEQQFIAISDAIRGIENPAKQINIAMDLFGRTGATILPTLKRGFDDVKNSAVGMAPEVVKALDEAGDAMSGFWAKFKAFGGTALAAIWDPKAVQESIYGIKQSLSEATDAAERAAPKFAAIAPPGLPEDLAAIEAQLTAEAEAMIKLAKAQDELMGGGTVTRAKDMLESIQTLTSSGLTPMRSEWDRITGVMNDAMQVMEETGRTSEAMYAQITAARNKFGGLTDEGLLPSTSLVGKFALSQAPSLAPSTDPQVESAHRLIEAEQELLAFNERQKTDMAEIDALVDEFHRSQMEATTAAVDGAEAASEAYGGWAEQMEKLGHSFDVLVPKGHALMDDYKRAGLFVNDAGSLVPRSMQPGASQRSLSRDNGLSQPIINVSVDARGGVFDTDATVEQFARKAREKMSQDYGRL